jgi:hypothetical protein
VFAVWAVAQSCWNQQSCLLPSNTTLNTVRQELWYFPAVMIS